MKNVKNFKMMICSTLLLASSFGFAQTKAFNVDLRQQLLDKKNPLLEAQKLNEQQKLKSFKMTTEEKKDLEQIFDRIKKMGGNSGGGGHEIGIEFHQVFGEAVEYLRLNSPEDYKKIKEARLEEIIKKSVIMAVDMTVAVEAKGFIQDSPAYNNPELGLILVDYNRWKDITRPGHQGAIAVHEVASLAGIERTGIYSISGEYAKRMGISERALAQSLAVNRLQQIKAEVPKASPYDILEKYFEEANQPLSVSDLYHGSNLENANGIPLMNYECRATKKQRSGYVDKELAWGSSSDLGKVDLLMLNATLIERAVPGNGPLFPGTPEKRSSRQGVTLCDSFGSCAQHSYYSFENSHLDISKNSIKQSHLTVFRDSNISDNYEIRKNNGLLVFAREASQTNKVLTAQEKAFGYCYPKAK